MHKIYGAFLSLALFIYTGNAVADPISDLGKCVDGGSTVSECYQSEARRYVAKIQEIYDTYAKDEFFNDFKVDRAASNTEKFRRIMNMWKMYAQNYCNLVNYTSAKAQYEDEDRDKCLYDLSVRQLQEIEAINSIRESDTF